MRPCLRMGMWPIHHRSNALNSLDWAAVSGAFLHGSDKAQLCCVVFYALLPPSPTPCISPATRLLPQCARPAFACHNLHLVAGPQMYVIMTGRMHTN